MSHTNLPCSIQISLDEQILYLYQGSALLKHYPCSTAKNGPGEQMGSECTPRGKHKIRARIGQNQPVFSVFTARRPTGEIYSDALSAKFPQRDWILSRILWLSGLEPGKNRYGKVDSSWRYIYIHGSPDHLIRGNPESHGCIRMRNQDIIELFDRVTTGTPVNII